MRNTGNPSKSLTDAAFSCEDSDFDVENDPELAILAAYLEETSPAFQADPAFRESLRSHLLETFKENFTTHTSDGD